MSADVIAVVGPVFGLVLLGFAAGRARWLTASDIAGLSAFVFRVAIPIMLFKTMLGTSLPAVIPWRFLLAYYGATLAIFGAGLITARMFGSAWREQVITGMCGSYANVVLLGIPLVLTGLGEPARVPLFLIVATQAAVLFTVTTLLAETETGDERLVLDVARRSFSNLAGNPILGGLVSGLVLGAFGVSLPTPLDEMADLLSAAALPCAVFSVGASLSLYPVRGAVPKIGVIVVSKNLLHPLLVLVLCLLFGASGVELAVGVVLAAAPVGINAYLFAQRYRALVGISAAAIVVSTTLSAIVMTFLFSWLA